MRSSVILRVLTAALILGYFLFFTWQSLHLYFDSDDMFNLYQGWSKSIGQEARDVLFFWKGAFRPLGDVFYRSIFALAGFNPLPFRIAALGVCAINMAVCFWFIRLISTSERIAALATLLFAFQARLMEAWYRTTVILDVTCFLFVYLAAGMYIQARSRGGHLSGLRSAAIIVSFLCALDAKEFAVSLPIFLIAWELLFNSGNLRNFLKSRAIVLIAALGTMTLIYVHGKFQGPDAMSNNPDYTPVYSYARFTATWSKYLGDIFVLAKQPPPWGSIAILAGMLALALAVRSRILLFAWIVIFFGLLPVSFSVPRAGFEMYVSYMGWVLYASALIVAVEDLITRGVPQYRTALACAVFVLVGWRVGKINLHSLRVEPRQWLYLAPANVRALADQMRMMHPTFPKQTRILFLEDGIPTGEWTPMFTMRLLYEDHDLVVDRIKSKTEKPPGWGQFTSGDRVNYDYVFTFEDGRYLQVQPHYRGSRE